MFEKVFGLDDCADLFATDLPRETLDYLLSLFDFEFVEGQNGIAYAIKKNMGESQGKVQLEPLT